MRHYLGIDIGTYASKGALVDQSGRIVAEASRPHRMIVPQAGWAEHRPREDWWNDFTAISRQLMSESGIAPADIRSVACSAIGPCMLPVDAVGAPLMNAVLYGVDTRAAAEIEELTTQIGEKSLVEHCGQALTSQSVGPKIPLAAPQSTGDLCPHGQDRELHHLPRVETHRPLRPRPLFGD